MAKYKTNIMGNVAVNDCLVKNFLIGIWNFDFGFLFL